MTTLIEHSELSVTKNRGKPQVWVGRSSLLLKSGFDCNSSFRLTHTEKGEAVLDIIDDKVESKEVKGKVFDHKYTVTGKGGKPFIDLKNLPEMIKNAKSVRVVYLKKRVIITVHSSDKMIEQREVDLVKTLDDGKCVKIASIFSAKKMREQLKRSGLNQIANDLSCQLAIELDKSVLDSAIMESPENWQNESFAAHGDLTKIDFSRVSLPRVNGLIVDASIFDVRTDKKAGKSRSVSADGDHTDIGAILLTIIEVMKRTNPAFINIEVQLPDQSLPKKEYTEQETAYNTIMTVFSSVINSIGFNIEQDVISVDDRNLLSLLAISKNLSIDLINRTSLVGDVKKGQAEPIEPVYISTDDYLEENRVKRESSAKNRLSANESLLLSSVFSGGGVLDRSIHDGLADMKLNAFCKFGMEWIEQYYLSNLNNNHSIWRDESFFLLGDVRHVDVYERRLCNVNGIFLGIPCIGASRSGLVKNNISCAEEHEIAGALFISAIEIIKSANPAFIVIENVPEYQNTVSMVIIRSVIKVLGFNITEDVLAGNEYGALENRKRLVVIATSKGFGENNMLDIVPSVVEKPDTLNDVLVDTPPSDSSWSWRDYLDAKAINDKAKGNNFDQQQLTGDEPKCGTIGRSYQKGRSTEPFMIFSEQTHYKELFKSFSGNVTQDHIVLALPSIEHVQMYRNNAENLMSKHNRRLKLKGSDKIVCKLSSILIEAIQSYEDTSDIHRVLFDAIQADNDLKQEFIATTDAISKATRLLHPIEHARVKQVPEFLINGLPATTAHEILGNGVVFSLFQALGRRIGAWLWNINDSTGCFLLKEEEIHNLDDSVFEYHPEHQILIEYLDDYTNCFSILRNADGTAYAIPMAYGEARGLVVGSDSPSEIISLSNAA